MIEATKARNDYLCSCISKDISRGMPHKRSLKCARQGHCPHQLPITVHVKAKLESEFAKRRSLLRSLRLFSWCLLLFFRRRATLLVTLTGSDARRLTRPFGGFFLLLLGRLCLGLALLRGSLLAAIGFGLILGLLLFFDRAVGLGLLLLLAFGFRLRRSCAIEFSF